MRELCFEDIMTTRVALPNFIIGCRMSEMRRRLLPSPTPDQQSVRRNLFGPIDHEENFKFVQAELQKIHAADAEKWNFDFAENKPKEGRFKWEAIGGSSVPSLYQVPNITSMNNSTTCLVKPTFVRNAVTPEKTRPQAPTSSSSSSTSTLSVIDEIVDSVALTTTGTTTVVTTTTRPSCTPSTVPTGPTTQPCSSSSSSSTLVKPNNRVTESTKKSLDNGKLQQTSITDMFKCKKRPLNGSSKIENDDQPPALVKRQRTTT